MRSWTRAELEGLDREDPLAGFRSRFHLPAGVVYLDGNSLGALPVDTPARVARAVQAEWGEGLIRSWNDAGWIDQPARVGDKLARLLGAAPGSVMVADSTSINLFKLLGAALALRPGRRRIVSEAGNFPTDLYVAQGLAALLGQGHRVDAVASEALADTLDDQTAVLLLTHVNYRSGRMHDMAALTRAAHAAGALVLWDLAHSAGAVPLNLARDGVDFAVGCGYKFLNGGPGAPAFLYVAPVWQDHLQLPLAGWMGHADPFAFQADYRPASGVQAAQIGTPAVLSLTALEVGVDLALEVDPRALRAKSLRLSELLIDLVAQRCAGLELVLASPVAGEQRGSQVSFLHPAAYPVMQALIAQGVIGDYRAPDILRFGITPLYLRHVDIWDAVEVLEAVLRSGSFRDPRHARGGKVT